VKTEIDVDRCLRAMEDLEINGCAKGEKREAMIADAIARIQQNPKDAMKVEYLGIKNYASFGDQREDHQYGFGPRHGSIVFRIGRKYSAGDVTLGEDHIYLLECVRDADPINEFETDPLAARNRSRTLNLTQALERAGRYRALGNAYFGVIEAQTVESHATEEDES
jgi:hypothetical protein